MRLQRDALVGILGKACAANSRRSPGRCQHVLECQIKPHQLLWVNLNLNGPHMATKYRDLGNTRHGQQARTNRPVGKCTNIHQ